MSRSCVFAKSASCAYGGAGAGGAVFLVGNGKEEQVAVAVPGFHRGQPCGEARLHVEQAAARKEVAAGEVGQRRGMIAAAGKPRHCRGQQRLRIEGERLQRAVVVHRHDIEMSGEHDGAAAAAALQREDVGAPGGIAGNGFDADHVEMRQVMRAGVRAKAASPALPVTDGQAASRRASSRARAAMSLRVMRSRQARPRS